MNILPTQILFNKLILINCDSDLCKDRDQGVIKSIKQNEILLKIIVHKYDICTTKSQVI